MSAENMIKELAEKQIPLHSLMVWKGGNIIYKAECPEAPLSMGRRMFSISKSVTAIAIGVLYAKGQIDLDDSICNYFQEYVTPDTDERIKKMTIRNMLMMRTCHSFTTYKQMYCGWVESFFKATPNHDPGTLWHYDTSSAHTLAALVERLSGKDLWEFIKKELPMLNLSEDSYFITDPQGVSMGGSGLVANAYDILNIAILLYNAVNMTETRYNITYEDCDFNVPIFRKYLQTAVSQLSPTLVKSGGRFDTFGYGYMIWRTDHNGFMLYGMGGQFAAVYPESQTILITTADTQSMACANDDIFDAFYKNVLADEALAKNPDIDQIKLPIYSGRPHENLNATYKLEKNSSDFTELSIKSDENVITLTLTGKDKEYIIPLGLRHLEAFTFSGYDQKSFAFGMWQSEDLLYAKIYVIDAYVGSVYLSLHFSEDKARVNVFLKKVEESLFNDFDMVHLAGDAVEK